MKTDIQNVNYHGEVVDNGDWWRWNERCDRCGEQITNHTRITTEKPDVNEVDFCCKCLRFFIESNIPYETAKQRYKSC